MQIPEHGAARGEIMSRLEERAAGDADWEGGRLFGNATELTLDLLDQLY